RPRSALVRRRDAEGLRRATGAGNALERASTGLVAAGLAHDSRVVRRGSLFVAISGEHVDGHDFVDEARARGAVAAIVERSVDVDLPQILVGRTPDALAVAAAWWYGDPPAHLGVIRIP